MPRPILVLLAALAFSCSKDAPAPDAAPRAAATPIMPAAPPPVGGGAPTDLTPPGAPPSPTLAPAAAAPPAPAPAAAASPCEGLVSKAMLDAISGLQTRIWVTPEPGTPGARVVRCEHRTADIDQHFGFYVECGSQARKTFAGLSKRVRKMARKRRGPWRTGLDAPGTFLFLSENRRCFGQVAGRLLLRKPDLGERIGAEIARNLRM
jgi:hypothetical protein